MTLLRKILPLVLLLCLCLGTVGVLGSCSATANAAKYDQAVAKQAIADLRKHILDTKGVGKSIQMVNTEEVQVFTYLQKASVTGVKEGEEPLRLSVLTMTTDQLYSFRLDIILDLESPETAVRLFECHTINYRLMRAEDILSIPDYTGKELMSFDKAEYPTPETKEAGENVASVPTEQHLKEMARDMLNLAIISLDSYMEKVIKHDREDFGFLSYKEKYNPKNESAALPAQGVHTLSIGAGLPTVALFTADGLTDPETAPETTAETNAGTAEELCTCGNYIPSRFCPDCGKKTPVYDEFWLCTCGEENHLSNFCSNCGAAAPARENDAETEEDLGPAFSQARISYALRMTLLGMGMVFAVLAILWMILAIFKLVFAGKTPKEPKAPKEKKTAPAPAPAASAPAIPAGTDPAVVAAITAAISEMIAADPDLSAQFAGGFRVVEFKKKSGKTSWNH